jgi:hypothetical protein
MRFSMKYWKIMAYFGSIALAVGIGVSQVGKEVKETTWISKIFGAKEPCTQVVPVKDCDETGEHVCGTYMKILETGTKDGMNCTEQSVPLASSPCYREADPMCIAIAAQLATTSITCNRDCE